MIGVSASILSLLSKQPAQKYDQLLAKTIYTDGENAEANFVQALVFLYSIGKIVYFQEQDVVELMRVRGQE